MKTIAKLINIPKDIVERVEKYQKENYLGSFTQAIIQLVIKGLEK